MARCIIIGGSAEAVALAHLVPQAQVYLPGPERRARDWPGEVIQGWPLAAALRGAKVVCAPHPCDGASARRAALWARRGARLCYLRRPGWRPGVLDRWYNAASVQAARALIQPGARVFVGLGREAAGTLRGAPFTMLWRQLDSDTGPVPPSLGRAIRGQGPFGVAAEIALMRKLRVDVILARDAGGPGGAPKLAAARALGLPVVVVARPRWPSMRCMTQVEEAAEWLMISDG